MIRGARGELILARAHITMISLSFSVYTHSDNVGVFPNFSTLTRTPFTYTDILHDSQAHRTERIIRTDRASHADDNKILERYNRATLGANEIKSI